MNIYPLSCLVCFFLIGCASSPSAEFPRSNLKTSNLDVSQKADDGTAIAFQFSAPPCASGGFRITERLKQGHYGPTTTYQFENAVVSFYPTGLTSRYLDVNPKKKYKLHVKFLPAGSYVVTRPYCRGDKTVSGTPPDVLISFLEFEVESGKTNYIGNINMVRSRNSLKLSVRNDIEVVAKEYKKRYMDNGAGAIKLSLAKATSNVIATTEDI